MTQKPEAALTKKILTQLRERGGFWAKIHGGPYQATGLPDIVGCCRGGFYGFEVKVREHDQPTARQSLTLRLIRQAGGVSRVVRGPADALSAMQDGHTRLYLDRRWLTASQATVMIGLELGDKPISRWKLDKLVREEKVRTRAYSGRRYYSGRSIINFLKGDESTQA